MCAAQTGWKCSDNYMEQVNALAKFEPEAVFPSRKHLYMERDEYHMLHGYKLVVPNSNKEQVIFSCWQAQQKLPKGIAKCAAKT